MEGKWGWFKRGAKAKIEAIDGRQIEKKQIISLSAF